jgi:thymidylate synthase ThyX
MKNRISATVLLDSLSPFGTRLTTGIKEFPRHILAEYNTHRMITKNSASSRAIPHHKMMEKLRNEPFIPIRWMEEHKGMQGFTYLDEQPASYLHDKFRADLTATEILDGIWADSGINERPEGTAKYHMMQIAEELNGLKVSKQHTNRLLEPFMYHRIVASATEWGNFFALRAEDHAEIHMQDLAYKWLEAMNASTPKQLKEGEWHLPFLTVDDEDWVANKYYGLLDDPQGWRKELIKVSTGKCAWVSYDYFEGGRPTGKAIETHDKLVGSAPLHASPAEHPARVMYEREFYGHTKTFFVPHDQMEWYRANNPDEWFIVVGKGSDWYTVKEYGWCGNFRGFIQYRKMLPQENAIDSRLKKHYKL